MIRRIIIGNPLKFTAAVSHYFKTLANFTSAPPASIPRRYPPSISHFKRLFSNDPATANSTPATHGSELTRVATLVDGCDYEHWLVIMEPPEGYPSRDQIVHQYYIRTLALVLGSEEEARKSIYSVSTKFYYAFSCRILENLTHKIKSLPNVRWVLPDSYLHPSENDYGGEPFVDGEVVPYNERYHVNWQRDQNNNECRKKTRSRNARRKERR